MNAVPFFVAGLLLCSLPRNLSADTPEVSISVGAQADNGDDARMVSALSREFRKLDRVLVTDTQPALRITCVVVRLAHAGSKAPTGYAASVAITGADRRLITHLVETHSSIDALAHEIAVAVDGTVIERMRRTVLPASSP